MKKFVFSIICGTILSSIVISNQAVFANSTDSTLNDEQKSMGNISEELTPFDTGYFSGHAVLNYAKPLDPNPRTKLNSSTPVNITVTSNLYSEPIQVRAYSPSSGSTGPWIPIKTTGSVSLPNSIAAGETVVPEAMTAGGDSTVISGSWYHN